MASVILSPHPDDAVLSCWHVLCGPQEARVIGLFGGPPESDVPSWWDALTGAASAHARAAERRQEDVSALALAGRASLSLEFADHLYRTQPLSAERVLSALRPHLLVGEMVLAPAALGEHPDHRLALEVGLALAAEGWEVRLYADLPHAIIFGWPDWITGVETDDGLDVNALWTSRLGELGPGIASLEPSLHVLNGAAESKAHAISMYRTQLPALARIMPPNGLRYEVTWAITPRSAAP